MADPTTIFDYTKQQKEGAQKAVNSRQQQLAAAQTTLAAQRQSLAQATAAQSALNEQADALRQQLAIVPTPADGEALLAALEQLIIRARMQQAVVLQVQTALDAAQAEATSVQPLLSLASAQLTRAAAQLKPAEQAHKKREELKAALAAAPLTALPGKADAALKATPFTDAQTRIEEDFPAQLLTRSEARFQAEADFIADARAQATAAEAAVLDDRATNGGPSGQLEKQWASFLQAEAAARDFAASAQQQFDHAQALLMQVADKNRFKLTAEQRARIHDATLKVARETSAGEEEKRDDARKTALQGVKEARAKWQEETLKAIAAHQPPGDVQAVKDAQATVTAAEAALQAVDDTWAAEKKIRDAKLAAVAAKQAELTQKIQAAIRAKKNPDADADVAAAKQALADAQGELKTAENNYQASHHGILHAWEAAVPDTMWQLLADYKKAERLLKALKEAKPAALKDQLTTAEADYINAQLNADANALTEEHLRAWRLQRAEQEQHLLRSEEQRLFGAVRGDR